MNRKLAFRRAETPHSPTELKHRERTKYSLLGVSINAGPSQLLVPLGSGAEAALQRSEVKRCVEMAQVTVVRIEVVWAAYRGLNPDRRNLILNR